ncbi:hypothetical protein [Stenotrophomonas sp. 278]|uniref:hypothetical protein n=1 Tax=Stenotrophomonas sp. 278 TaxID=2479851 RepID=UPI000F6927AA|nr:hypothetical protein [Stenotrophomonas sp. 278]RRU16044.1 hypothetical protein EGJ34_08330 [Stenotrophomonas sp. 278]
MSEVAAYVLGVDEGRAVALLSSVLGPLVCEDGNPDSFRIHTAGAVTVVVIPNEGMLEIWVHHSQAWASSPEFARFLAAGLECTVRCDPDAEAPDIDPCSDALLEIDREGERIVTPT